MWFRLRRCLALGGMLGKGPRALGAILLVLGAGLLAAEVLTPGVGVFAGGGTISLLLGGMFLFRGPIGVSPTVLLPVAVVVGGGSVYRYVAVDRHLGRLSPADSVGSSDSPMAMSRPVGCSVSV